jgi:hypothetical protein
MKLKPLSLTDICPEDASFTLADGTTYTIRKFTLSDQAWIQKTFGGANAVQQAFTDPESMVRIVFHQLPVEQQKAFTPITVERVDEDTGELVTEKVGGWRLFAGKVTNTAADIQGMAEALTRAIVGSNALVEDEAPAEEKKTSELPLKIGASSSISSPVSTATASM